MTIPPTDPHDFAKWLLATLEGQAQLGEVGVRGRLPAALDWGVIDEAERKPGWPLGYCTRSDRTVELYPETVGVFASLEAMLRTLPNQVKRPDRFSLLQERFDSAAGQKPPVEVARYLLAVKLAGALTQAADAVTAMGERLLFIKGHETRITVKLTYSAADLVDVPGLEAWIRDFVDTEQHREQKRILLRQSLLDLFKGSTEISLAQLLPRFAELDGALRAAYALYMADFTFEKVKAEVEKDNLDSSIKIGKAVSDIQNQLLAMPVALLLAGGQMEAGLSAKNIVLMLSATVFAWLMNALIANQRSSLDSIAIEVDLRSKKVAEQPAVVSGKFKDSFDDLEKRVRGQRATLRKLELMIAFGLLCTVGVFLWMVFDY